MTNDSLRRVGRAGFCLAWWNNIVYLKYFLFLSSMTNDSLRRVGRADSLRRVGRADFCHEGQNIVVNKTAFWNTAVSNDILSFLDEFVKVVYEWDPCRVKGRDGIAL